MVGSGLMSHLSIHFFDLGQNGWVRNAETINLFNHYIFTSSDPKMSDDDESDMPVAESSIGKAIKEQCKLDKDMLGMMKVTPI